MWNINPRFMCDQHIRGEHFELHKAVKCIESDKLNKIKGHTSRGQLDTSIISQRHKELEKYKGWNSPIDYNDKLNLGNIDIEENIRDLAERCDDCRKIMKNHPNEIYNIYEVQI